MPVNLANIQVASAKLAQIAFSAGEEADPQRTLAAWRHSEGIEEDALEQAAAESADGSIEEIEQRIADGEVLSTSDIREYLLREYETAWQVGWIARARRDARDEVKAANG